MECERGGLRWAFFWALVFVLLVRVLLWAAEPALAVPPEDFFGAGGAEAQQRPLVADKDRAECPQAAYGSVQEAVDAAVPDDPIAVCPDRYTESVVVRQSANPARRGRSGSGDGLLLTANRPVVWHDALGGVHRDTPGVSNLRD